MTAFPLCLSVVVCLTIDTIPHEVYTSMVLTALCNVYPILLEPRSTKELPLLYWPSVRYTCLYGTKLSIGG